MLETMKSLSAGFILFAGLSASIQAQTYWLNIPGSYSKPDAQYLPSISLPTAGHEACSGAVVQYARDNLVHYIGCDIRPLADAVNLKTRRP